MQASLNDPASHKYCLKSGTMPLLQAAVDWFDRTYGVRLDPETQALSLVGSQEGLAHLLMAVADPGDGILMTDVAYPSYFGAGGGCLFRVDNIQDASLLDVCCSGAVLLLTFASA
jgi:aspartate/methionine/tyrosine aminotransferase